MYQMEAVDQNTYTLVDLFSDLNNSIVKKANPDVYGRSLQRNYVDNLIKLVDAKNPDKSDVSSIVRGNLILIKKELSAKADTNTVNQYHYEDLAFRIEKALDPK